MKATINVEFTDDELLKYAEDVGRRWAVNFFAEAFKTGKRMKLNPNFMASIGQALASAFESASKSGPKAQSGPLPENQSASRACARWEASADLDEAWVCCCCSAYNGLHRSACRRCGHVRCDFIVPPPPPPRQDDPSVQ